jgi:PHP family Zn ribbon phosphoesterase
VLIAELVKEKMEGLAKLIIDNRIANLKVQPGYDGEYGKLVDKETSHSQKTL